MSPRIDEIVAEAIQRLPVGIAVSVGGSVVFANELAQRCAASKSNEIQIDGRKLRRKTNEIIGPRGDKIVVTSFVDVTTELALEDDLFRRAYFDDLTGLPNRALLAHTVETLIAGDAGGTFGLAFIDLDGFKHINDYYGHAVGDALLVRVAQRLSEELGPSDVLARLGGDEMMLLLPGASAADLEARIPKVLGRLKAPFFIEGHEIFASASIGVSRYPDDGRSYDQLCTNADSAMYRVKSGTKGAIEFFDGARPTVTSERARIEQRLRLVIRDKRICCAYQPKVDFRSGEVSGIEVLLRWRDEDGVANPPGDFVNLAVDLGLMDEISHMVFAETVGAMPLIDEAFGSDVSISLNVAARQANDQRYMRGAVDALVATGQASRFMLELTEEAFVSGQRFQDELLPMVREAGMRVSIDDFGVGYSSLATLCDITADELKVDRSFITAIHERQRSQGILRAIESLGNGLGMSIVVEGVETGEELDYLRRGTSIRLAQGFYFARPMLLEEIPAARSYGSNRTSSSARAGSATRESTGRSPAVSRVA
jgi:diguanylate cyclase (GGDEF)-like protein